MPAPPPIVPGDRVSPATFSVAKGGDASAVGTGILGKEILGRPPENLGQAGHRGRQGTLGVVLDARDG